MKNLKNRCISFVLAIVMLVSTSIEYVFAGENQTITVDGYTFQVLNNSFESAEIKYDDGNETYIFTLNRMNMADEATIEISKENPLEKSVIPFSYTVEFDEDVEYTTETEDFSSVVLVDENTGYKYSFNENAKVAWAVPIGIGLTSAAIEALLAIGSAIIIGGVACVVAEEVAQEIKKQKEYRYYEAFLRNNSVYVGSAIQLSRTARELAQCDNEKGTVMATSFAYAKGITGGSNTSSENHGSTSGYWEHIHALKSSGERYKAHIWFLD